MEMRRVDSKNRMSEAASIKRESGTETGDEDGEVEMTEGREVETAKGFTISIREGRGTGERESERDLGDDI
jgi:hypothetical protein